MARTSLAWLALASWALASMACSSPAPFALGLKTSALTDAQIQAIRSFRVMSFDQTIYRCDRNTGIVRFGNVGYTTQVSFDWSLATSQNIPETQLYLPNDAVGKPWLILVEAYSISREAQATVTPMARGCASDVQVTPGTPSEINVTLYPVR